MSKLLNSKPFQIILILLGAAFLTYFTVIIQTTTLGKHFLTGQEYTYHQEVLQGNAGNPYQYRILSSYAVMPVIRLMEFIHYVKPVLNGFLFARYIQNFLLFILVALYFRKLGLNIIAALLGISILAWGMTHSLYDSYLSFDTYFDVIFYILAGLAILSGKYLWLLPVTILAVLNRETSGLILLMLPAYYYFVQPQDLSKKKMLVITGVGLAIYVIAFVGLRLYFGEQVRILAYGHYPGINMVVYNLTRPITYRNLLGTLTIVPFLALLSYSSFPAGLKGFFWAIVPAWFAIITYAAILAESRLVLVPQALVFIPGALFGASMLIQQNQATPKAGADG